jgi:ribosomal protein S12 methylthiotransferase accessory factor
MLPQKHYVKFYQGLIQLNNSHPETALGLFRQALALGPSDQDRAAVFSYMGVCLKDMGQFSQALTELEKGAQIDPERTDIHNLMGYCHFKLKSHHQAIACFEKAIALNPGSAIDYANIGSNYRELGNTSKAIDYYRIALQIDPSIAFAKDGLKRLEASVGT